MAPELWDELEPQFNNKSDIFAFGCILHQILFGSTPFRQGWQIGLYGQSDEQLKVPVFPVTQSKNLEDISNMLRGLMVCMLSKKGEDRPGIRQINGILDRLHGLAIAAQLDAIE